MGITDEIVKREWDFFQLARNEGGRASCQNDWETFRIMRESQFEAWSGELQESYLQDLKEAEAAGWNLVAEKYARMMESTAPEQYQELEAQLPPVSAQKRALADAIAAVQVGWMEDFAEKYPHLAGNARAVHTVQDTVSDTSAETYLRGELLTYSEQTLRLYGAFVARLAKEDGNLNTDIMERTVKKYGYASLADAEDRAEP